MRVRQAKNYRKYISIRIGILFVLSVIISSVILLLGAPSAQAATSSNLNFQGRILTSAGAPVADGIYNLDFRLYDGGTASGPGGPGEANSGSLLWSESYTGSSRARVVNGYFSVNLGSQTPFPGTIDWEQELWLTMNVGGSTAIPSWDGEMLAPGNKRTKLTGVPYAFRSGSAKQLLDIQDSLKGALSFLTLTADRTISLPDASGTVVLDSTGFVNGGNLFAGTASLGTNDNNDLVLKTNNLERFRVDQSGNVSIGTGSDGLEKLEVNGGIKIGNTTNANAGTIRWTGSDFEGYNGTSWVSLTSGGSGTTFIGTSSASFVSSVTNLAANSTAAGGGYLVFTSATRVSSATGTGSATFVAPASGSFRSCTVIGNANRTGGTATLRWRVNGASVGSGACIINAASNRTSSTSLESGVVTFNAGDAIGVAWDSASLAPTSTEYTAYWTVGYDGDDPSGLNFVQGGNSFGSVGSIGTNDGYGLNIKTNGITAISIATDQSVSLTNALTVGNGLSVSAGGMNVAGNSTINGSLSGLTGINLAGTTSNINFNSASDTTLNIENTGAGVVNLNIEGAVRATSFTGDGSGLTTLDASNISSGTLDDLRLSSNIARLNATQAFSGLNTFDDGLVLGSSVGSDVAGAIRWNGMDFEGYNGTSWVSFTAGGGGGISGGQVATVVKTSNETVNNSNVLQDDDELFFDVGANEKWAFRFVLQANSGATPDLRFAVTAPSGAVCRVGFADIEGAKSIGQYGCGVTTGVVPGNTSADVYEVVGTIENGATAGTVHLQWAQFTANASNTIVYAGSYLFASTGSSGGGGGGASGTVTGVMTGTGLDGGPITTSGTISIADTGVVAGTYGDANSVPVITVNAQGQITAAGTISTVGTINGLSGGLTFVTGSDGSDFNITAFDSTVTLNIPDAGASSRGLVIAGAQSFGGVKTFNDGLSVTTCTSTTNVFCNSGNTFGADAIIGINDSYKLNFETANTVRMVIDASGNVGIATGVGTLNSGLVVNTSFATVATTVTTSTSLNSSQMAVFVNANSTTQTLPTANSAPGRIYNIKNIGTATDTTIDVSGGGTIDGNTTYTMGDTGDGVLVQSNGTSWSIISSISGASYPQVLVNARRTTALTLGTVVALAYNNASVNVGNAYNTSTGVFTAPATGVYSISAIANITFPRSNIGDAYIEVYNNTGSASIKQGWTGASNNSGGTTYRANTEVNTMVSLSAGQQVSIRIAKNSGGTQTIYTTSQTANILEIVRQR